MSLGYALYFIFKEYFYEYISDLSNWNFKILNKAADKIHDKGVQTNNIEDISSSRKVKDFSS